MLIKLKNVKTKLRELFKSTLVKTVDLFENFRLDSSHTESIQKPFVFNLTLVNPLAITELLISDFPRFVKVI